MVKRRKTRKHRRRMRGGSLGVKQIYHTHKNIPPYKSSYMYPKSNDLGHMNSKTIITQKEVQSGGKRTRRQRRRKRRRRIKGGNPITDLSRRALYNVQKTISIFSTSPVPINQNPDVSVQKI